MDESTFKNLSELPISKRDRNIEQELFGKKAVDKIIDKYEQELGYPQKQKKEVYKYKNRIFSPSHSVDESLLNELLNDDGSKYKIIFWKDTWTVHGDFKIFVIYSEVVPDVTDPVAIEKDSNE